MNRKWLYLVMAGALLLGFHGLNAQEPPPPPPPGPEIAGPEGPIGPRVELLGFGEMHPGKVVTGAPYSAVAVTEHKQTLADGNTIERKVQSNLYRDSQGRTRRETTFNGIGPLASSGQPRTAIMIHDPVAGTSYILHPEQKTAEQLPAHKSGARRAENFQGHFEARMQKEIADGTLKKEDLGTQTINGIAAQGTRYTKTIPAGQIGNASPILVVNEQWYSPDLQIIIKSTRTDPRTGQSTYTVSNIQRTEPAASLFVRPADYTVTPAKMHGRHRLGSGAPPPPGSPNDPTPPPGE